MEYVVEDAVRKITEKEEGHTFSEKDLADIEALALNSLPPRYIVTEKGEVFSKVDELSIQFQADVTRAVMQALNRVKDNPRD
jgi:competence protein ComFB